MRAIVLVVLMLGPQAVGPVWAGDPQPSGPWEAYRGYLKAAHGGDVEPYLTDEGLAQWRGFSPEARKAAGLLLYGPPGLQDAKLVSSKIEGQSAQLDAILYVDPFGAGQRQEVKAHVELVRGGRGWGVRSETLTPPATPDLYANAFRDSGWTPGAAGSWAGLQAPGVFPASVQAKADAELRDRKEGDRWAVTDVKAVISGEAAYGSQNNGYYDRIECLVGPSQCIPGYPRDGAKFLEARLGSPRNGYKPRFDLGPKANGGSKTSPSSVLSYAYWLIPEPGRAGRAICGDATGIICTLSGPAPATKGECPVEPGPCVILR